MPKNLPDHWVSMYVHLLLKAQSKTPNLEENIGAAAFVKLSLRKRRSRKLQQAYIPTHHMKLQGTVAVKEALFISALLAFCDNPSVEELVCCFAIRFLICRVLSYTVSFYSIKA
jgi:hypothetical protein